MSKKQAVANLFFQSRGFNRLAGPANKDLRNSIVSVCRDGAKVPHAQTGLTACMDALFDLFSIDENCRARMEGDLFRVIQQYRTSQAA